MVAIIIPARYASTRFPAKVLADLNGKPLLVWVIEQCLKSKADKVIVVTDSDLVIKACDSIKNIKCVMSSADIKTGSDRVAFVAKDLDDEIIINVQGDEPFIPYDLIDDLIDTLKNDNKLNMVSAATEIKDTMLMTSSDAVKVVLDKDNFGLYFSRFPIPFNRDNTPDVKRYKHIGIYGYRRKFLLKLNKEKRTPLEISENLEQLRALENGEKIKIILTDYNPISVDTRADLEVAKQHIINRG